MPDIPTESLDRLLAGELSRSEERRLAQAALDDPDLFDALTAAALTKAALAPEAAAVNGSTKAPAGAAQAVAARRPAWRSATLVTGLAAAAALVLAVAYEWKSDTSVSSQPASPSVAVPAAPLAAPVLLTAHLDITATPTFRAGAAPTSRPPKQVGIIVRVGEGTADVDIGSLDGLKQGMAIPIVRGSRPLGRMTMTAVFRERARGRVDSRAAAQPGDRLEVDRATHVRAILEQVTARRAAGDLSAAHELAMLAVSAAQDRSVPADIRRRSLAELGTLERQRGNLDQAMRLFQEDIAHFDSAPAATPSERVEVLNELGVLQIENRDLLAAERTLQSAQALAAGPAGMRVTSNLGALAALRGDRATAERLYRVAASLAAGSPDRDVDRQVIAKNLAALQPSR